MIFFSLGAGFVIAYESGLGPDTLGHDIREINWSRTIPTIRADQICLSGDCKAFWEFFVDTKCDHPGTCGQVCIGGSCRTSWPSTTPLPPTCNAFSVPKWTGSAWSCVPVDIGAPLYYDCPSLSSSCVDYLPCRGGRSTFTHCNRQVYVGGFCSGCGCYYSQWVACTPRYS